MRRSCPRLLHYDHMFTENKHQRRIRGRRYPGCVDRSSSNPFTTKDFRLTSLPQVDKSMRHARRQRLLTSQGAGRSSGAAVLNSGTRATAFWNTRCPPWFSQGATEMAAKSAGTGKKAAAKKAKKTTAAKSTKAAGAKKAATKKAKKKS